MRGIFSAGVLDVFLESGFDPFDLVIGVSAGACNLASHVAGQHGRNRRCYYDLMTQRSFIDARRLVLGRSMVDLDWLWTTLAASEPLDVDAILASGKEFIVVATSGTTGGPVYLRPRPRDMFDVLKGSCALPLLYRPVVTFEGERLVDGGVSDPIPVEEAYRRGARRILVIRSRPAEYVKTDGLGASLSSFLLRSAPVVATAVRRTAQSYQRAVAFLREPPSDCQIVHVAPEKTLATRRTTQDRAALEQDYALGRELGVSAMRQWHATTLGARPGGHGVPTG